MVAARVTFTAEQRLIIDAFEIAERTLDAVLVPRSDVFVLDADWTCERALKLLAESGHHTSAPVAAGRNLDDAIGLVHLRQLFAGGDESVSTS